MSRLWDARGDADDNAMEAFLNLHPCMMRSRRVNHSPTWHYFVGAGERGEERKGKERRNDCISAPILNGW